MKSKTMAAFTALLLTVSAQHAVAEKMGEGSYLDRRVQTAFYTPDNVFRIHAFVGRSSLIQFPANETINEPSGLMVSGDKDAWEIGVNQAGNLVAIKPKDDRDPNTNLIISTNRHTYLLELKLVNQVADMTYALRFTYPDPPKKPVVARDFNPDPCPGPINTFQVRGDESIAPTEGWDNGTFTCFRFVTNAPRPVVYQVLPDGTETLANVRNVQNIMVVHGVSQLFRFRLNTLIMEAKTRQQVGGFYNYNGTTTGEIREVKHAEQ
jgi:type IV secretion system protein VirB9